MASEEGTYQESLGSGKHYGWQLSVDHRWLPIDNDHVIEAHYCQPGAKGMTINTNQGKVFIDFDTLQTRDAALKVQRISFLPQGQTEDIGWYYRDEQLWCEYGSQGSGTLSSSVSSGDIERQYTLYPQGTLRFTVGSTPYSLDFSTMTQTNLNTGLRRNVRRRPKFTSNAGSSIQSTSVLPTASSSQLANTSFRWEFLGNDEEWIEYQAHVSSLDSAFIEAQYQLNPQGQLHFKINRYSYTLDFSGMCQINNNIGTRRTVRRTPQNSVIDPKQSIRKSRRRRSSRKYLADQSQLLWSALPRSTPRWQFQDISGIWTDYSKGYQQCSTSSQDIELQYQQNPTGTMIFTTKKFTYELNFAAMTQRNMSTNTTRSVRRLNQ